MLKKNRVKRICVEKNNIFTVKKKLSINDQLNYTRGDQIQVTGNLKINYSVERCIMRHLFRER